MRTRLPPVLTTVLGLGLLALAAFESTSARLATLALFGAGIILSELVEGVERGRSREPVDDPPLRIVSGVHVAAVVVLGPWPAALAAGAGALVVNVFRGAWRRAGFHAAVFALAALAAGEAFRATGGDPGSLRLLDDLIPLTALSLAYLTVRTLLLELVGAGETFHPNIPAAAAESGLGAVLALLAIQHAWNVIALVPLALAVNLAHVRSARLRRETLRALETLANIVDERDPSTYRHSARVAGYVDGLARALRFPFSDIDRLRWAGRLHDLGKVAVDAAVLAKPGRLSPAEWAAVRRSPRLSARLLQRFQFAAGQARAVEFHHERYDGCGYYGVAADDLPLAAHFLVIADSFDAMTTERPYRPGLSREEALEEIERNIGTQFHPAVAKAFVAVQRGLDPFDALEPEELEELRSAAASYRMPAVPGARDLRERPELLALGGMLVALVGIGVDQAPLAVVGAALASFGVVLRALVQVRATRVEDTVREALAGASARAEAFERLVDRLHRVWNVRWAALVRWHGHGLGGTIELDRGDGPLEPALMSWLVREAESHADVMVTPGRELGRDGIHVAVPLRLDTSELVGFFVLEGRRSLPRRVELALVACGDEISAALSRERGEHAEPLALVPEAPLAVPPSGRTGSARASV